MRSCCPDALQYGGLIIYEGLCNPVTEASPVHIRLDAGNNALEYPICYLFLKTLHQCPDITLYEPIPEKPVHYADKARNQDNPYPNSFDGEPMVDKRQRRNDGDEVEKVGTQVRSPVPAKSAAGKELNSRNDTEPDIKYYPGSGHRSVGAEDPDGK